jgi:branched-chain amino acid transport system permease protein
LEELLFNSFVAGILLGGFYAAISLGLSISFGMLDIVNIAHPVFIVLGSYCVFAVNKWLGIDPILCGILFSPIFFLMGYGLYQAYYQSFEKRGAESLRSLVFFFGLLFLIEVGLQGIFGVDYRSVRADWIGKSISFGWMSISLRMLFPFLVGLALTLALHLLFSRTFFGIVCLGVAQDSTAVRLIGADPARIKAVAFALSVATTSIAGALLICITPIEPYVGRELIGRIFAVAVLAGMGSMKGTLIGGLILGIAENLTATMGGPAWALAVSFGILFLMLIIKPSGLFGVKA